jgi:hypothetical protein
MTKNQLYALEFCFVVCVSLVAYIILRLLAS